MTIIEVAKVRSIDKKPSKSLSKKHENKPNILRCPEIQADLGPLNKFNNSTEPPSGAML